MPPLEWPLMGYFIVFSAAVFTPTDAALQSRCAVILTQEGGKFGSQSTQNGGKIAKIGAKLTKNFTALPFTVNLNHNSGKLLENIVGTALPRKKRSITASPSVFQG